MHHDQTPGFATGTALSIFLRISRDKLGEVTTQLGLCRGPGGFPWMSIWSALEIHNPPPEVWDELKQPLLTSRDVAAVTGMHDRTVRRWRQKDARALPDTIMLGPRTLRFRRDQVFAFSFGLGIPRYEMPGRAHAPAGISGLGAYPDAGLSDQAPARNDTCRPSGATDGQAVGEWAE